MQNIYIYTNTSNFISWSLCHLLPEITQHICNVNMYRCISLNSAYNLCWGNHIGISPVPLFSVSAQNSFAIFSEFKPILVLTYDVWTWIQFIFSTPPNKHIINQWYCATGYNHSTLVINNNNRGPIKSQGEITDYSDLSKDWGHAWFLPGHGQHEFAGKL